MVIEINIAENAIQFIDIEKNVKIIEIPITAYKFVDIRKFDGYKIASNPEVENMIFQLRDLKEQKDQYENNTDNKYPEEYPEYENVCYDIDELRTNLLNTLSNLIDKKYYNKFF